MLLGHININNVFTAIGISHSVFFSDIAYFKFSQHSLFKTYFKFSQCSLFKTYLIWPI